MPLIETLITVGVCVDTTHISSRLSASPQKCSPGFYRELAGPYRGQCVPCSCSGFSSECDEGTGKCRVGVQMKHQQSEGSSVLLSELSCSC